MAGPSIVGNGRAIVFMAIYDFRCLSCGATFEAAFPIQAANRSPSCGLCGSLDTRRIFSMPGVIYKTEGFTKIDSGERFESQLTPRGKEIWKKAQQDAL